MPRRSKSTDPRPRRVCTPRWWAVRIGLCILVGLVATLATAWGPAVARAVRFYRGGMAAALAEGDLPSVRLVDDQRRPRGMLRRTFWWDECHIDPADVGADRPLAAQHAAVPLEMAPRWAIQPPAQFSDGFKPPTAVDSLTIASGWPARSIRRVVWAAGADGYFGYEPRHTWSVKLAKGFTAHLPLDPIWTGLALTLAFWTVVPAPVFILAPLVRRSVRRRRGRCAACGYPRIGPGVACPECGEEELATAPPPRA